MTDIFVYLLVLLFGGQSFLKLLLCVGVDGRAVCRPHIVPLTHPCTKPDTQKKTDQKNKYKNQDLTISADARCRCPQFLAEGTSHHLKTTADNISKNMTCLSWWN